MQTYKTTTKVKQQLSVDLEGVRSRARQAGVELGEQPFVFSQERVGVTPPLKYVKAVMQLKGLNDLRNQGGVYLAALPSARDMVQRSRDETYHRQLENQIKSLERVLGVSDANRSSWQPGGDDFEVRPCHFCCLRDAHDLISHTALKHSTANNMFAF